MAENGRDDRDINIRDDLFGNFQNLEYNDNNRDINALNNDFLALTLRERLDNEDRLQNEAAAIPVPIETSSNDNNFNTGKIYGKGAVPKRFSNSRTFFRNSSSDPDLTSPIYRSNFAQHLHRNSAKYVNSNKDANTQNLNPPNTPNQQNRQHTNGQILRNNMLQNNPNARNSSHAINYNLQPNQTINDILQMAVMVPNFDGTENTFENFEISCQDAAKILSVPNQKIFMKYIRDKFSGPIKLYLKIKLSNYADIDQMLNDIKTNFMVRTPIHLLESKIYSTSQKTDESVKEFGAKLSDLQNILISRIKDKFQGNLMNSKIAEVENKVKKQLIQGLKRDLYVQFSLIDFRNNTLDQTIQIIAKNESKNRINENFDKSSKKVNFDNEKLDKAELVEALTVAMSHSRRPRDREQIYNNTRYRDYSRENYEPYNHRRRSNERDFSWDRREDFENRRFSRDRRENYKQNRNYSGERQVDYGQDRPRNRSQKYDERHNYRRQRDRSNSRGRSNYKDRYRNHSRDNSYSRRRMFTPERSSSYDRSDDDNTKRNFSRERNHNINRRNRCDDDYRKNAEYKNNRKLKEQNKKREVSNSPDRNSDDSNEKNAK